MSRIKNCILHIGMNKTGSSAIQEYLHENDLGENFYYVKFSSSNHSSFLRSLFSKYPEKQFNYTQRGITLKEIKSINKGLVTNLLSEIEKKAADTYILSGEGMLSLDIEELQDLYVFLNKYFEKITVVGYVREPWSFIESLFQQALKGGIIDKFEPHKLYPKYQNKFEKFYKIFGDNNVSLWEFNTKKFQNGDVVNDFCLKLGLAYTFKKSNPKNESLSLESISLLFVNRKYFSFGVAKNSIFRNYKMIDSLIGFGSNKFEIDQYLMNDILEINYNDIKWIEEKLSIKLPIKKQNKGIGITCEEDFFTIAKQYVDSKFISSFKTLEDIANFVEELKDKSLDMSSIVLFEKDYKIYKNVLMCKNGWYFLYKGHHKQFDYLLNKEKVQNQSIINFSKNLESRATFCKKRDIKYRHIVFPSKPIIKKEYLPDEYKNITSLFENYYEKNIFEYQKFCLYPIVGLLDEEEKNSTFQKKGTHNTDIGYLTIVNHILENIGLKLIDKSSIIWIKKYLHHDLSKMVNDNIEEREERIKAPKNSYIVGNKKFLPGNTNDVQILYNKEAKNKSRILIFGDSFFKGLLKILNIYFIEIVYIRSKYFHKDIVDRYRPDIVFTGNAERYLCDVELDQNANDYLLELYGIQDYNPSEEYREAYKAVMSYRFYKKQYNRWVKKISQL